MSRQRYAEENEMKDLEVHLESALAPVNPRAEFIRALEDTLARGANLDDFRGDVRRAIGFGFTAAVGLLGGVLALAVGVRAIIALFNLFGYGGLRRS
jgi:hypothetical protein